METDQRRLIREIGSGSGHLSQKSRLTWFGLGAWDLVQSVRIRWPIDDGEEIRDPSRPGLMPLGARGEAHSSLGRIPRHTARF